MNTLQQTDDNSTLADRLQPRGYQDLVDQADMLIQSRLCPDHFEDAADIVLVAQQGAELGVTVMTALQNSHVIHGNVGWDADFLKALCIKSGEVEKWKYETKTSKKCELTVQRTDNEPETFEWTKQKAEHAGLWGSSPAWKSQPDVMLRHRVDSEAARSIFPDVVAGIHTPDELRQSKVRGRESVEYGEAQTSTPEDTTDKLNAELVDGDASEDEIDDEPDTEIQSAKEAEAFIADALTGIGVERHVAFMDFLAYHHTGDYSWNSMRDEDKISLARDLEGKTPSRSIPPRVIGGVDQFLRDHDIGECNVSHSLKNAKAEVSKHYDLLSKE